jgi:hypothetical protein
MNQTTSNLLMVRPVHFGFNEQTASTNSFQEKTTSSGITKQFWNLTTLFNASGRQGFQ